MPHSVSSGTRHDLSPFSNWQRAGAEADCAVMSDFFFSSRRRHTRSTRDWSSDVCSSDLTGRTAGPDRPPYAPARAGRMVAGSMAMPSTTLISESPAAPAATQAPATATMSVTSGDSYANAGMSYRRLARTAATTDPAVAGSRANRRPASSAFGHERLISTADTPG